MLFDAAFMSALKRTADYFITTEGAILAELTFAPLLDGALSTAPPEVHDRTVRPDVLILQADRSERVHAYRNLVRECFARGTSALIIAPTLVEVEHLAEELCRGIEDNVFVVTSAVKPTALKRTARALARAEGPVLVVGTPAALSLPTQNVDTIILEREGARAYVTRTRPVIDLRVAVEHVAEARGARLILADFPLRAETFARRDMGSADELARAQVRTQSTATTTIVDARTSDIKRAERRTFSALQPDTYTRISEARARGARTVIYAARKGLAPLTLCNDCGTPVTDPTTDTPMVLHKTPRGNVFLSHRTGAVLPAERSCSVCGGWNLVSLGIGVERVDDEVRRRIKGAQPIIMTADTTPTHRVAERLIKQFYDTPGSILIGTERMLPYVQRAELVIVASIDSTLSRPEWRAHEAALATLYALAERAEEHLIIETRHPESAVLKSIASGSPVEFVREELRERRAYGYPPYALFIGLSYVGTESECAMLATRIKQMFADEDLVGPLPPEQVGRGQYRARAVIRRARGSWPDESLAARLRALPPSIALSIDPDEIV
jgi:primosomal protein N' (replication factor Y)